MMGSFLSSAVISRLRSKKSIRASWMIISVKKEVFFSMEFGVIISTPDSYLPRWTGLYLFSKLYL